MTKHRLAFLVPAHNEEKVIEQTIRALLKLTSKQHIYVVNDGSTDKTQKVATKLVPHVYHLTPNQGKASAMNECIDYYKITKKYQYLMPMDADTIINQNFLDASLPTLDNDPEEKICAVVGKVVGRNQCPFTTYRLWEYEIAQTIHKSAQSKENAIVVCPGCSTIYRTKIFDQIKIPTGTLTEDMDLTFLIHRQNLGRITFVDKAVVVTQDPNRLKDYIKQIDRWYTGFWQCVLKNNIPWGGQMLDLEVALLASEGLFYGLLTLSLLFAAPIILIKNPFLLIIPMLLDLFIFTVPTVALTSYKHKAWNTFKFIPHFYFLRLISSLIFLKSFAKIVLRLDLTMTWHKTTRYDVVKDQKKLWLNPSIQ